jgi:hypothetical protein
MQPWQRILWKAGALSSVLLSASAGEAALHGFDA